MNSFLKRAAALLATLFIPLAAPDVHAAPQGNASKAQAPGLEYLQYHHSTSAMGPYYSIEKTPQGFLCRIAPSQEIKGKVSEVIVPEHDVNALLSTMVSAGALGWNGFSKSRSMPAGMLDGDDYFSFELRLADGTNVKAHGSHARPEGFKDAIGPLMAFFKDHQDYSRYYPLEFPDAMVAHLRISYGTRFPNPSSRQYSIELNRSWKQWSLTMKDPKNTLLATNPAVSTYKRGVEKLPFDAFVALLKKHGFPAQNRTKEKVKDWDEILEVSLYWDNGQEYRLAGKSQATPEFLREFVDALAAFHGAQK